MRHEEPTRYQRVLNRRHVARHWTIPEQPHERWVRCRARIVWEHDGIEWIKARATRWTLDRVWVEFADGRLYGGGVWLDRLDVQRR